MCAPFGPPEIAAVNSVYFAYNLPEMLSYYSTYAVKLLATPLI